MRLFIPLLLLMSSVQAEDIRRLTVLHSNDLHARLTPDANHRGGFAHLATLVRRERAGCSHCLYLHAGDLVQGTPVSTIFRGEPVYTIGNKLKFDVAYLKNIYDVVLIDTPPILAVNDALLLAPAVDGTILVLRAGAVSEKEAIQSKERLAGCLLPM